VIEVGAGHGANFAHYPEAVTEVLAVEPEPRLRAQAREASRQAPIRIEVVDGVANELPAADASFDAGIASLVLCSVPDQLLALQELRRVIRPGGELRFYEHVVSRKPSMARFQRLADATIYPRLAGGCHLTRDTTSTIEEAGFAIRSCERFPFKVAALAPSIPHILGTAERV